MSASDGSPGDTELPHGWTRLGPHKWSTGLTVKVGPVAVLGCYFAFSTTVQILRDQSMALAFGVGLIVMLVALVLTVAIINLRFPQPWVNFDAGEIRTGKRTASFAEIDSAWLLPAPKKKGRVLTFRFGVAKGPQVIVTLRDANGQVLDRETARIILEVLRRSNVRMPVSKDDPTGRFARYNFPGHLTLDDAIAVVESPPGPTDPLPVESL